MKNIFLALAFLAQLYAAELPKSPAAAMHVAPFVAAAAQVAPPEEDVRSLAIQQKENQPLADQLKATHVALQQNPGLPKVLVLGAYPSQRNHFIFPEFGNNVDLFSIDRLLAFYPGLATIDDMYDPHFIKADLTDINFLNEIATQFAGQFDLITVDWSVTKFFSWNFEYILKFAQLLKPGGKFVFDYSQQMLSAKSAADCQASIITKPSDITADLKKFPLYNFLPDPEIAGTVRQSKSVSEPIKALMRANYINYLTNWVAKNGASDSIAIEFEPSMLPYWNPEGPHYIYIIDSATRFPCSYIQITKR